MAELIIPFARRSGTLGTAHLIAGLMARGAGRAFAGFAKRMAARRTIAQLRALDARPLRRNRSDPPSLLLSATC
jgi:hypothetical protein